MSIYGRQLVMLGLLSSILSFVFSALEVLYTFYAMNDLRVSAAEWSQVRAGRFLLTIVIVLVLGTWAGKIGHKKALFLASAIAIANVLLFAGFPSKWMLFLSFPLHIAFVSMITLSVNVLVQEVPLNLQSVSNTVYRTTYTRMAILGPLALGLFADVEPVAMFLALAVCLSLCLPLIGWYPQEVRKQEGKQEVSPSVREQIRAWRQLLGHRRYVIFDVLVSLIHSAFLANTIFGPVKLIQTIGLDERQFSYVSAFAALTTTLMMLAAGFLLRKMLMALVYVPLLLCSLGNVLLGLQTIPLVCIMLYIVSNAFNMMTFASISIWSTRLVPQERLGHAFAFHKILISVFGFLFSMLLSAGGLWVGVDASMVAMGIFGILCGLWLRKEMRRDYREGMLKFKTSY